MSINFIQNFFLTYFPNNRHEWKQYAFKSIPVILGTILFSLNGFVDNFMVTHISGGVESLGYSNVWTGMIINFLVATAIVGSLFVGQYYAIRNYKRIIEVIRIRIILSFLIVIGFVVAALAVPHPFLNLFSHGRDSFVEQTISYNNIIVISWVLLSISFNQANLLREVGYIKASFLSTFVVLATNIIFNSIFLYGLNLGVRGAAWASVISRVVSIFFNQFLIWKIDKKLFSWFWKPFLISKIVFIQFIKRVFAILLQSASLLFIVLRTSFWNLGFPSLGDANFYITGASVLSLTTAISNIMTSSFSSVNSTINFFVASNLGVSNFKLATINSKKMLGFKFISAFVLSVIIIIFVYGISQTNYFALGVERKTIELLSKNSELSTEQIQLVAQNSGKFYLSQLVLIIVILTCFNPVWILSLTAVRVINSGGNKSNFISLITSSFSLIHLIYLILIVYFVLPISPTLRNSLPLTYFVFFSMDIIKAIVFLFMMHKIKWQFNVNIEYDRLSILKK